MAVYTLRKVVEAKVRSGITGGLSVSAGAIRGRWWELKLECGHTTERSCRWPKGASGNLRGWARLHAGAPKTDPLPAPKRVRCYACKGET